MRGGLTLVSSIAPMRDVPSHSNLHPPPPTHPTSFTPIAASPRGPREEGDPKHRDPGLARLASCNGMLVCTLTRRGSVRLVAAAEIYGSQRATLTLAFRARLSRKPVVTNSVFFSIN